MQAVLYCPDCGTRLLQTLDYGGSWLVCIKCGYAEYIDDDPFLRKVEEEKKLQRDARDELF